MSWFLDGLKTKEHFAKNSIFHLGYEKYFGLFLLELQSHERFGIDAMRGAGHWGVSPPRLQNETATAQ